MKGYLLDTSEPRGLVPVSYKPQPATRIYYPYEDLYIGENLYNSQIPDL